MEVKMETMKLLAHIGTDGILQFQTHTDFKDKSVEVLVVVQALDNTEPTTIKHNAWGKATTKKSIQDAISRMQQLRKEVGLDKNLIREMIEEGRKF
jgi:hypothetical protein